MSTGLRLGYGTVATAAGERPLSSIEWMGVDVGDRMASFLREREKEVGGDQRATGGGALVGPSSSQVVDSTTSFLRPLSTPQEPAMGITTSSTSSLSSTVALPWPSGQREREGGGNGEGQMVVSSTSIDKMYGHHQPRPERIHSQSNGIGIIETGTGTGTGTTGMASSSGRGALPLPSLDLESEWQAAGTGTGSATSTDVHPLVRSSGSLQREEYSSRHGRDPGSPPASSSSLSQLPTTPSPSQQPHSLYSPERHYRHRFSRYHPRRHDFLFNDVSNNSNNATNDNNHSPHQQQQGGSGVVPSYGRGAGVALAMEDVSPQQVPAFDDDLRSWRPQRGTPPSAASGFVSTSSRFSPTALSTVIPAMSLGAVAAATSAGRSGMGPGMDSRARKFSWQQAYLELKRRLCGNFARTGAASWLRDWNGNNRNSCRPSSFQVASKGLNSGNNRVVAENGSGMDSRRDSYSARTSPVSGAVGRTSTGSAWVDRDMMADSREASGMAVADWVDPPMRGKSWWEDRYEVDWTPKDIFLKFRQHIEGYRLGANIEINSCQMKFVLKPGGTKCRWKLVYTPTDNDIHFLTKKIPIGSLMNFQVGVGHDLSTRTTGWKWKLTSPLTDWTSQLWRHKSTIPVCPGLDMRIGWHAEYIMPNLQGALGTGEPAIALNVGYLAASIERVEAIFTHSG